MLIGLQANILSAFDSCIQTSMAILSINAGSSSLKFSIYPYNHREVLNSVLKGEFQGLEPGGSPTLQYTSKDQSTHCLLNTADDDPFTSALSQLKELISALTHIPPIKALSHRIVHGASIYQKSVIANDEVLKDLARLNALAPLHQPHNLKGVQVFMKAFPHLPQVLCFDTAYHSSIPSVETALALPPSLTEKNIKKYGFHGLSYQFIIGSLQACSSRAHERVLMAHLGNGASLCAAVNGKSMATTMGFSTLDGLMMGTRVGALDPGVMLYLLREGFTPHQLETLLYSESGLLGVSTVSADMRTLRSNPSTLSKKAIDLFTHRVVRESGAMIACMKGLDVVAFSGGIGEHDHLLRESVCSELAWLGIELDSLKNQNASPEKALLISKNSSSIEVWVVPTDEGKIAAKLALEVVTTNQD
jgi:acetate kinase